MPNKLKVYNTRTGFHARVKSNGLNEQQCALLESTMVKIQMIERQLDIAYYRHNYGQVQNLELQKSELCKIILGNVQS